jgi:hypothetical protein
MPVFALTCVCMCVYVRVCVCVCVCVCVWWGERQEEIPPTAAMVGKGQISSGLSRSLPTPLPSSARPQPGPRLRPLEAIKHALDASGLPHCQN